MEKLHLDNFPDKHKEKSDNDNEGIIVPIQTEVALCKEQNLHDDCGPLALEMVLLTEFPENAEIDLASLKAEIGKKDDTGTMPGDICRVLKNKSLDVTLISSIDWESILKSNPDDWDPQVGEIYKKSPKMIDIERLKESSRWLLENKEVLSERTFTLEEISKELRAGSRIIAIVQESRHYVVITGIDNEYIYFNNPKLTPEKEKKSHKEFLKWWGTDIDSRKIILVQHNPVL